MRHLEGISVTCTTKPAETARVKTEGQLAKRNLLPVTGVPFAVCLLRLLLQFLEHHAHSYHHTSARGIPSAWDALHWLVHQATHLSVLSTNTLSSLKSP